jgi:threonine/homoserine/homoserine lactone efflux protein
MTLFDPASLALFVTAALALNLTPGPDMAYVSARAVGQGREAGVLSALGITTGRLLHLVAAVLGLSTLLASSAAAARVVRVAGGLYLLWLGIRMIVAAGHPLEEQRGAAERGRLRIYLQGVATNALNPKVALFYLAFLPQFVDPRRGSVALQLVILGTIQNLGGTLVQLAIAWTGGGLGDRLRERGRWLRLQRQATGGILALLGARLLLPSSP